MSLYPSWWNKTITIFNKYEDSSTQQITWYKKVINNCYLKNNEVVITQLQNQVNVETDSSVCRIPKSTLYRNPSDWLALSAQNKAIYFTLKSNDIIIAGNIADTINEYTSGSRSSDLLKKYKDAGSAFVIQRYADNSDDSLCLPHYFVRGI